MRIVLVQSYITSFAVQDQFYNVQSFGLASELSKKGHEVTIITSSIHRKAKQRSKCLNRRQTLINGYRLIYLPTIAVIFRQPIMPTLLFEIARIRPDIVQASEDFHLSTLMALVLKKFFPFRIIVYQGTYHYASRKPSLHKLYAKTVGKLIHKYADHFIAKTTAAKKYLLAHGVEDHKITVLPVGFLNKHFHYVKSTRLHEILGIQSGKILLNVGRLVPEKNHQTLIWATKQISQKFDDVYLVILGDGPEKNNLLALVDNTGLSNKVFICTTQIPNNQMKEIYSDTFLYLIPSSYEPFNMTMLEAMACRVPIIASNEGGMADVILNDQTGYLLKTNDYFTVSKYVCDLIEDKRKYNKLKQNAQKSSLKFAWSNLVNAYLKVYANS